jgi:membrane fusion protein (multidrug efflux system)
MENTPINKQKRKRWLTLLSLLFIVIGLVYLIYWLFDGRFAEETDDAYVSGNLVQVMPRIAGHVTKILADETDLVTQGQPVVMLDTLDAAIALKKAAAQLAVTARQVSQWYRQAEQLKADVLLAKNNLEKAQEDYQRRQRLIVNKTISAEELRHAKIAVISASASLASTQNKFAATRALIENSDLYHHPQIRQAVINFRMAYLTWRRTTIKAPATGYIAKRPVQIGQQVTPSTVLMIIVPLDQLWVNANFKESQLQNMRIGQAVKLISDLYSGHVVYHGTVVGLNPGSGNAFDLLPAQNATGNWIKIIQRLPVRIALDPAQLKKYPLRIGLSMTATIDTHHRQGRLLMAVPQNRILYQTAIETDALTGANQLIQKILHANAKDMRYPALNSGN